MLQAYQNLLESPGRITYLAVRNRLLRDLRELPSPFALSRLWDRVAARDFAAVPSLADAMASVWCLSPRFHFLLGMAADALGDAEQREFSQLEFSSCLQGILATGAGTQESPFVITYATDVLDVLDVQAVDGSDGPVEARRSGTFDILRLSNGREYFFRLPRRAHGMRFLASPLGRERLGKIPQRV